MLLRKAYAAMTKPGVQNPHWEPWASASLRCSGWRIVSGEPRPSTVTTEQWSREASGARHAFTARWAIPLQGGTENKKRGGGDQESKVEK